MKKTTTLLVCLFILGFSALYGQNVQIKGTVTSAVDGSTVPGAYVLIKGTNTGTVTDANGNYALSVPSDATLVFSSIGMKSNEVAVNGQTVINVILAEDVTQVDEVVVTALGISREKKSLGYAVQDIKTEELTRTGNANLSTAMQGKVAGLEIKPSSGMPGASSLIVIRGARSFTGNNTPLYIIDGMPIASAADYSTGDGVNNSDISNRAIDLNPEDIESINVLKGQSAAALYGIRASNGVIVITTKSGKNNKVGRPVVTFSHTSTFDQVSRKPEYQKTYAQGSNGLFAPTTSLAWGPKIVDLPDDPGVGGNGNDHDGLYYVKQLNSAGLDPWVKPGTYDNFGDFFGTGYSSTYNLGVSQANESGNFAVGIGMTDQSGIVQSTGLTRWNVKGVIERNLNKNFKVNFNANYSNVNIDKLSGANDAALQGVYTAPANYNLKGIPYRTPTDPYSQIHFRSINFDNPYWALENNTFNEKTDRFFGNGKINYNANLTSGIKLNLNYQLGVDAYSTHFQDIFGYGHAGEKGTISNYGVTSSTYNSLFTAIIDWNITNDFALNLLLGNELNHNNSKYYSEDGTDFNFGGWNHIDNAGTVTASEAQWQDRTVGFFGNMTLSYKSMLYLGATGRNDIVSSMPRGNRSFFYPSVSLGFVASELDVLKNFNWLSYAKIRGSYAEVGQAGSYRLNYYDKPNYEGGFWNKVPIIYPIAGVNSYIPYGVQYDPNLKPQNTKSYEVGVELKFLKNRLGIDYTYSRQNVVDQIFSVPLAGSTGASSYVTNGGKVHTTVHELVLYMTPVQISGFQWDINVNYSKITNVVDELATGVESIFLGGFTTPQVRAGIGSTFPVIYGGSFARDEQGHVLVEDDPTSPTHGMPLSGPPAVIGEVSPDFILGATNTFTYKGITLSAVIEWKNGGEMYAGTDRMLDYYGVSKRTEDRESTFIYDGYKPDGTKNDIVRGGPNDPNALQTLNSTVNNIDEYLIRGSSFVKIREISLRYKYPKKLVKTLEVAGYVFSRNILVWTEMENFDPESSQGNTNMAGAFERFSLPQTTSYGFGLDFTF